MKALIKHNDKYYFLSNENLCVGDAVYPIARGVVLDDEFYFQNFDTREFISGFPDDPHIIEDLHHSNYKPYEFKTNCGFGAKEKYYKIVAIKTKLFDRVSWTHNKE